MTKQYLSVCATWPVSPTSYGCWLIKSFTSQSNRIILVLVYLCWLPSHSHILPAPFLTLARVSSIKTKTGKSRLLLALMMMSNWCQGGSYSEKQREVFLFQWAKSGNDLGNGEMNASLCEKSVGLLFATLPVKLGLSHERELHYH